MPDTTTLTTVSRADLARSATIHRLHGAALLVFGGGAALLPLLLGKPAWTAIPATVVGLLAAAWIFGTAPPPIGSRRGHVLVATSWIQPTLSLVTVLPHAAPVLIGFGFVAPLAAFRLSDRRHVAAHVVAATACVFGPIALGLADTTYVLGAGMLMFAFTLVPVGVVWVLEQAEQQSDQLRELSLRDPLTGAGNRRLLEHRLAYEVRQHARSGSELAVAALDLDGFKRLNDEFGHQAGDDALQGTAQALTDALRASDTVIRTGGDEFVVLLPSTSPAQAAQVTTTIRRALAAVTTPVGAVRSGIGLAAFPRDGVDPEQLLAVADAALLTDKRSRRATDHHTEAAA